MASGDQLIRSMWDKLSTLPGGKFAFSKMVGRIAPYTSTIHASVHELGDGHATISMNDRKHLRNHLKSIHAMALANLAEITTGLAVVYTLPKDSRGILIGLEVEFVKKGRGKITASCEFQPPSSFEEQIIKAPATLKNPDGEVVTRAIATWKIGRR